MSWQQTLQTAIRSAHALLEAVELSPEALPHFCNPKDFPCLAPHPWVERMEKGNPNDPLLLQTLPQAIEYTIDPSTCNNPLQEDQYQPVPGLLHKYHGRVLLTLTGACPIHCRYCFRRHFDYNSHATTPTNLEAILSYLQQNPSIREVILSGGDPLSWPDQKLQHLLSKLSAIKHISCIRLHTRFPIIIPNRINKALIQVLQQPVKMVMVVHCNHPNELNQATNEALLTLHQAGIHLFNQSVLLKGINDCGQTLTTLSLQLFAQNVIPYYLHRLDPVQGASHFRVDQTQSEQIMQSLQSHLPGYLVPKWVAEVPGMTSKKQLLI